MVYFIKAEETPYIKIGFTENLYARISDLQIGCPYKLKVVRTIEGSYREEKLLHTLFAAYHKLNEWFEITEDMVMDLDKFVNTHSNEHLWQKLESMLKQENGVNYKSYRLLINTNFSNIQRRIFEEDPERVYELIDKYRVNIGQE